MTKTFFFFFESSIPFLPFKQRGEKLVKNHFFAFNEFNPFCPFQTKSKLIVCSCHHPFLLFDLS